MTIWEPLRAAVLSARSTGQSGQSERGVDTPVAAAADGGEMEMFEVNGRRWPRRADLRNALVASETEAAERKWKAEIARLQALVADASEARNAQLRALGEVSQAANAIVRREIDAELEPALRVAWTAYVAAGSSESVVEVGRVLVRARDRAAAEYGTPDVGLVAGVLRRIAWAHGGGGYPGEALLNAFWTAASWSGESVALLQRVLSDILLAGAKTAQS